MNRTGRQLVGALLALAVAGTAGARTLMLTDLATMMMACIHADHPRSSWA
ncbi:hypothetical protein HQ590_14975, partial [bacterium]|nr:hypothetical protein [bacterium]